MTNFSYKSKFKITSVYPSSNDFSWSQICLKSSSKEYISRSYHLQNIEVLDNILNFNLRNSHLLFSWKPKVGMAIQSFKLQISVWRQLEMKSSYNKLFLRLKTVARKGSNQSQTGKTSIRKEPEIHSLHGHRNRKLYMRLLLDAQERRWTRNSNEDGRLLASKRRGISETTCFMMISFEADVKRQFQV